MGIFDDVFTRALRNTTAFGQPRQSTFPVNFNTYVPRERVAELGNPMAPRRPPDTQSFLSQLEQIYSQRPELDAFKAAVQNTPTREEFKPSKMRRLGAALVGGLQGWTSRDPGQGISTAMGINELPYQRGLQEHEGKVNKLQALADIESQDVNRKATVAQWGHNAELDAFQFEESARQRQQEIDDRINTNRIMLDLERDKWEREGKVIVPGDDGITRVIDRDTMTVIREIKVGLSPEELDERERRMYSFRAATDDRLARGRTEDEYRLRGQLQEKDHENNLALLQAREGQDFAQAYRSAVIAPLTAAIAQDPILEHFYQLGAAGTYVPKILTPEEQRTLLQQRIIQPEDLAPEAMSQRLNRIREILGRMPSMGGGGRYNIKQVKF